MTADFIVGFGKEVVWVTLLVAGPMLLFGLIVGLIVSVFQAVTQVHEMTLTFIPKILAVMFALVLFFPWMMRIMLNFTEKLFVNIPLYIR
ncbi:MAG: flagellar biosynthesis protein FliQ [Thermodesulfobacteriota bacterium]|jgi:flagellar biosynthetic protein FliQ|nr:flagellar biosynthesis protein FliQ [Thermodesulfobacteriota bacterium]